MLIFTMKAEKRDVAIARFLKTGGKPPKGATLLGRWVRADFSGGFDLLESDDSKALTEFALEWSDLMDLVLAPVVEDDDLIPVLKRAGKNKRKSSRWHGVT